MADQEIAKEILKAPAETWLQDEYIVYSRYVVSSRAITNYIDGLKPVARRILYSMFEAGYLHNTPYRKAIKVVGEVLGNYHPHGDASVADALARLAQPFNMRVPLVGHYGSIGIVTGDQAAAPRYYEVKLSRAAFDLLREINENAVPMGVNFDGTRPEPTVLPARWPANIVNGTSGIAVGFASNMPAHNPSEVMDTLVYLIDNPDATVDDILKIMPGPDLPTGGQVFGVDGIKEYYTSGTGSFVMRASYEVKQLPRGRANIVITELPFGVTEESVITKINTLRTPQEKGKGRKKTTVIGSSILNKGISSVKCLTDKQHGLRISIEVKPGVNIDQLIAELFAKTPMQSNFNVNNTVIKDGRPACIGMLDLLLAFLDHRRLCVVNKAEFKLQKIRARLLQLEAILSALGDMDACVAIIRGSESAEEAAIKLQSKFHINDVQANYLLSMQLRRLTKADSLATQSEHDKLSKEADDLNTMLNSGELIDQRVKEELIETKAIINDPRRTVLTDLTLKEMKDNDKALKATAREANRNTVCYITRFANGLLMRTTEPFSYSSDSRSLEYSPIIESFKINSKDDLVVVLSTGVGYRIPATHLAVNTPAGKEMLGLSNYEGDLVGVGKFEHSRHDVGLAVATSSGGIKITRADYPITPSSFPVVSLSDAEQVVDCRWCGSTLTNTVFTMVSSSGKVICFEANAIAPKGSKSGTIAGMKLPDKNDHVIALGWTPRTARNDYDATIMLQNNLGVKHTSLGEIPVKNRGGQGVAGLGNRAGQKEVTRAVVGFNLVAVSDEEPYNLIATPALMSRTRGCIDLPMQVMFGSLSLNQDNSNTKPNEQDNGERNGESGLFSDADFS